MSGIRTSMSTTSGSSRRADSIASRPVFASPTTVRSSAFASIEATPCRTSSWSSTSITRMDIARKSMRRLDQREPQQIREEADEHDNKDSDREQRE